MTKGMLFNGDLAAALTRTVCACRYGVDAIGIFCPDCGSPLEAAPRGAGRLAGVAAARAPGPLPASRAIRHSATAP